MYALKHRPQHIFTSPSYANPLATNFCKCGRIGLLEWLEFEDDISCDSYLFLSWCIVDVGKIEVAVEILVEGAPIKAYEVMDEEGLVRDVEDIGVTG